MANPFANAFSTLANPLQAAVNAIIGGGDTYTSEPASFLSGGGGSAGSGKPQGVDRLQRRVSRKPSRSASRHASGLGLGDRQSWHIAPNPHCNGGLRNAVGSVSDRLRRKLWVGVLGTPTDRFDKDLREDINMRMREAASSLPVWIPDAEFAKCYDEFCHQVREHHLSLLPALTRRRSSGHACTTRSRTRPRPSRSTSPPPGRSTRP